MRKYTIIIVSILALMLAACQNPVMTTIDKTGEGYAIQTTSGVRYVKNSNWDPITLSVLTAKAASRATGDVLTDEDLAALVDDINTVTDDDQLFIVPEDIPAEEGPFCTAYVVNECDPKDGDGNDWAILAEYKDIPREEVKNRRYIWETEAMGLGGILFIDKVPPKPVIIETRTPEEKYIIYVLYEDTGEIYLTYNCVERTSAPDYFTTSGYKDIDEYYNSALNGLRLEHDHVLGKIVITGYFYTPPSQRPPEEPVDLPVVE